MRRVIGSVVLACVIFLQSYELGSAQDDVAASLAGLFGGDTISVHADSNVVSIDWRCPGIDWEVTFCIAGSTRGYAAVIEAIRDKKIDIAGRLLTFTTLMHRHGRDGKDSEIVLLAASWDGAQLTNMDWKKTTTGAAIDTAIWVQADRNFLTGWALSEVCNSLYGNPPLFCALARLSSRR